MADLPEPTPLFEWLRQVYGPSLSTRDAVRLLVALACDGRTGDRIVIGEDVIATDLGVTPRQVRRYVREMVERGELVQTEKPTVVRKGKDGQRGKGRRARYRLTTPSTRGTSLREDVSTESSGTRGTSPREDVSTKFADSVDIVGPLVGHPHAGECPSLPSGGFPSSGAGSLPTCTSGPESTDHAAWREHLRALARAAQQPPPDDDEPPPPPDPLDEGDNTNREDWPCPSSP